MRIVLNGITLAADNDRVVGVPTSPYDAGHSGEVVLQESNPIRANRRKLYPRGQRAGVLTFSVTTQFNTLAAAGEFYIMQPYTLPGTAGVLTITPAGGSGLTIGNAACKACKCDQQGVSITATYTIEY